MQKSSFISIVGRPSSGKSTLINFICKEKISIVAKIPQTTRNRIKGIYSEDRGQLIFIDTPGFHISDKKFNKRLSSLVVESIEETELILYLIDINRAIETEEKAIIKMLLPIKDKVVVGLNKIDCLKNNSQNTIKTYEETKKVLQESFDDVYEISALDGYNVDLVIDKIFAKSTDENIYYPTEYKTDSEIDFRITEIVREKVILNTKEEVPYAVFVRMNENIKRDNGLNYIRCTIIVDTESQKGIVVGKNGSMIKKISMESRKEIEFLFGKTYLELTCKVNSKWKTDEKIINRLIY